MSGVRNTICLKAGTRLDDRYEIIRLLGMGGFGITYAAENIRVHRQVAIKEFFNADYMSRNTEETDEATASPDSLERLKRDRGGMLREARIVSSFSEEPGIVHIIDYFEANGTAYIVMEYLDGITLAAWQRKNGVRPPEEVFRKMLPVMETLEKIHGAHVLHRDISPDNIMVMKDGTLCLMDFGAAVNTAEENGAPQLKDGYAPIEQYAPETKSPEADAAGQQTPMHGRQESDMPAGRQMRETKAFAAGREATESTWPSGARQGPWTDVYGLAATMYTCITGEVPPDALMRSTYDELRTPSQLGVEIDPRLEKILMKGMALHPEDRFGSMEEWMTAVRFVLPVAKKKRRRTKYAVGAGAAALCAAVLVFGIFYRTHEAAMRFRGQEVDTVWFSAPDDMTVREYEDSKEILHARMDVLAGEGNYTWRETKEGIKVEFPHAVLGGCSLDEVAGNYLAGAWRECALGPFQDLNGNSWRSLQTVVPALAPGDLTYPAGSKAVPAAEERTSSLNRESNDTDGSAASQPDSRTQEEAKDSITFAVSARLLAELGSYAENCEIWIECGSGSDKISLNAYSIETDAEDASATFRGAGDIPDALRSLAIWDITHAQPSEKLDAAVQHDIAWDETEGSVIRGTYQQDAEKITDDPVIFRYQCGTSSEKVTKSGLAGSRMVFEERLDACREPYALGTDPDDPGTLYVKIGRKAFGGTEAEILGKSLTTDFSDTSLYESYSLEAGSFSVEKQEDHFALSCLADVRGTTSDTEEQPRSGILLVAGKVLLAADGIFDARDGELRFSAADAGEGSDSAARMAHFADLLNGMAAEDPAYAWDLAGIYESGDEIFTGREISLPEGELTTRKMCEAICAEGRALGGEIDPYDTELDYGSQAALHMNFHVREESLAEETLEISRQLLENIDPDALPQIAGTMELSFSDGSLLSDYVYVSVRWDKEFDQEAGPVEVTVNAAEWSYGDGLGEEIRRMTEEDSFWRKYDTDITVWAYRK